MKYVVVAVTDTTVTLWDGMTVDAKRINEMAGKMEIYVGPHAFAIGQQVTLVVRPVAMEEAK